MIDSSFTHDTVMGLDQCDTLHKNLKESEAHVNNSAICFNDTPECKSEETIYTEVDVKRKEAKYNNRIALLIGANQIISSYLRI